MSVRSCPTNFGAPWLALCAAFAFHILDEALTGFLQVYNPTVQILRQRWGWFPMPQFEYREWLVGLLVACAVLLCMTPLANAGTRALRPLAWIFSVIMLLNGLGHSLFSVLGHTVPEVTFARPAPGFYFFACTAGRFDMDDRAPASHRWPLNRCSFVIIE